MNANELADMIDSDNWVGMNDQEHIEWEYKAATMLRQQQAELNAFKLQYYNTGYSIQLRDKDETIRQQQAEIEALKESNKNLMELVTMFREEVNSLRQLQAENEALKKKLDDATNVIQNIVWGDRKPFDENGWSSVSFNALAKGADFLGNQL